MQCILTFAKSIFYASFLMALSMGVNALSFLCTSHLLVTQVGMLVTNMYTLSALLRSTFIRTCAL